jgi:SPP1 gp7 family putative phage head morphogenesis protein
MSDLMFSASTRAQVLAAVESQVRRGRLRRIRRIPRPHPLLRIEADFSRALIRALDPLFGVIADSSIRRVEVSARSRRANRITESRMDSPADNLAALVASVKVAAKRLVRTRRSSRKAASEVSRRNRQQLERTFETVLNVALDTEEPWLKQVADDFVERNASLVTRVSDDLSRRIEDVVASGFRNGLSTAAIASQIEKDFVGIDGVERAKARRRARVIARDQIAALNGELSRIRQTQVGVQRYRWRTSLDERVRSQHQGREGKIFRWDEPPSDGHPGQPILCRCTAEPVLEDLL